MKRNMGALMPINAIKERMRKRREETLDNIERKIKKGQPYTK